MLRWFVLLVAVLPLAACDSGWVEDALPFSDSQAAAVPHKDEHCTKVAYARAADAKANGYEEDMRDEIYARTYADCEAWDRAHPAPQEASQ